MNRFVQSLLLAQGQFAKLLYADKDSRNKLLEDITNSSIYRTIGIRTFNRFSKAKNEVATMNTRIGEVDIIDAVIIDELNANLENLNLEVQKLNVEKEAYQQQANVKNEWAKMNRQLISNQESTTQLAQQEETLKPIFEKLNNHSACIHYREPLLKVTLLTEELLKIETTLVKQKNEQQQLVTTLEQKKIEIKQQTDFPLNEKTIVDDLRTLQKQLNELVVAENEYRAEVNSYLERIKDRIAQLQAHNVSIENNENAKTIFLQQKEFHAARLKGYSFKTIADLRNEKTKVGESLEQASILIEKNNHYLDKSKQILEKSNAIKDIIKQSTEVVESQQSLVNELQVLKKEVAELDFEIQKQKLHVSLDQHRSELKTDEPCPLCGSLHHPYQTEINLDGKEISVAENTRDLKKKILEDTQKLAAQNEIILKRNNELEQKESAELLNLKEQVTSLEKERNVLCTTIGWDINTYEIWPSNLVEKRKEKAQLDQVEQSMAILSICEETIDLYIHYEQKKSQYIEQKNKREGLFKAKDFNELIESHKTFFRVNEQLQNTVKQSINDLEAESKEKENTLTNLKNQLLKDIEKIGVSSIEQLRSRLLPEQEAQEIRNTQSNLSTKKTVLTEEYKTIKTALEELATKDNKTLNIEQIQLLLAELQEKIKNITETTGSIKEQLKKDAENRKRFATYESELKKLNQTLLLWTQMNSLIGDANGKKFLNFVQDITLRQLIQLGNKRLQKFSDRYLLDLPSEKEDTLMVIDTYMGNTTRAVTTLSGGESFMISIALAFGLADFSSKNVNIESLFIDEGFGSLDEDSLEQAIGILELIQSESNKSIGIISHVAELKDRIATKVKLTKGGNGFSTIEIEG